MIISNKKVIRCSWVNLGNPLYVSYHDNEWGIIKRNEKQLFESLCLEILQAGLSWQQILVKRIALNQAFDDFDYNQIMQYKLVKICQLMNNPQIIRNKLKIDAIVNNAKAFILIQQNFKSFYSYLWQFNLSGKQIKHRFTNLADYPSNNKLSQKIAEDLKKQGFKFIGPTIIYSYLQAIGVIDDHQPNCFKA